MKLYERSPLSIWTDPHIARNLLAAHLDPTHDGASRNPATIARIVRWISSMVPPNSAILDFGCGPGLYAEALFDMGHRVTGVDVNQLSIDHAKESASRSLRAIAYFCANYLEADLPSGFDAALCIYCDFGALSGEERAVFLRKAHAALKPGGVLIFDVFGHGISPTMKEGKNWDRHEGASFWSSEPCYHLEETRHFPEANAWGRKNILVEDNGRSREFFLWDTYFDETGIATELESSGFELKGIERGLVARNAFTSDDVLMCLARKNSPGS